MRLNDIEYYPSDGEMLEAIGIDTDRMPHPEYEENDFEEECDKHAQENGFVPAHDMAAIIGAYNPHHCVGWVRIIKE